MSQPPLPYGPKRPEQGPISFTVPGATTRAANAEVSPPSSPTSAEASLGQSPKKPEPTTQTPDLDIIAPRAALEPQSPTPPADADPKPTPEVVVYPDAIDRRSQPTHVSPTSELPQKQHTVDVPAETTTDTPEVTPVPFTPKTDTTPVSDATYEVKRKIHALDIVSMVLPSREQGYKTDRTVEHYQNELQGIDGTLDHIREHSESGIVVDLGAGRAVATKEMAEKEAATGGNLTFVATSLTDIRADTSSPVPYIVTSSEDLRGFPPSSVSGFIAVFSLYHTYSPEKTITNLDNALEPGGVIKANFRQPVDANSGLFVMSPEQIMEELRKKDYDIATARNVHLLDGIILAIKPGGTSKVTAKELLDRDFALHQEALSDAVKKTAESTLPDEKKAPQVDTPPELKEEKKPQKLTVDAKLPDPRRPLTERVTPVLSEKAIIKELKKAGLPYNPDLEIFTVTAIQERCEDIIASANTVVEIIPFQEKPEITSQGPVVLKAISPNPLRGERSEVELAFENDSMTNDLTNFTVSIATYHEPRKEEKEKEWIFRQGDTEISVIQLHGSGQIMEVKVRAPAGSSLPYRAHGRFTVAPYDLEN